MILRALPVRSTIGISTSGHEHFVDLHKFKCNIIDIRISNFESYQPRILRKVWARNLTDMAVYR